MGIQNNGELFVWFKDKDILKTVSGLEGIVPLDDLRRGKYEFLIKKSKFSATVNFHLYRVLL